MYITTEINDREENIFSVNVIRTVDNLPKYKTLILKT